MFRSASPKIQQLLMLSLVVALIVPQAGCGFLSHAMYWINGNPIAARYPGLKKKTVAVVCFDANAAGPAPETEAIAIAIGQKLQMHGDQITVIDQQRVADWMDNQSENVADFKQIGRGVKADMVVGVEIDDFRTHEGSTIMRGHAKAAVRVYDLTQGGKQVYEVPMQEIVYPENGGRPIGDEVAFRRMFIDVLARRISKDFYRYERQQDFGNDALIQ